MAQAKRDENRVPTLIGVSSADGITPTLIEVNPTTNSMLVDVQSISAGTSVIGKVRVVTATGDEVTEDTDNSMNVTIVADDVGIGGGIQYTEGDTDATITGQAILWEDAANTLVTVNATKPLPVDLGTNNDVTLATLPDTAAGDLAAMVVDLAAIEVLQTTIAGDTTSIDGKITAVDTGNVTIVAFPDNEPFNMAQVSGTAVSVNAGVLDAGTQRVTIATDDEVNNLLGTIDADTSTLAGAVAAGQVQVDIVADGADLLTNTNFAAAFGTAGVADSQVMSIQGIASMTPVTVDLGANNDVTLAVLPDTAGGDLADIETNTDFGAVVGGGAEATALRVTLANDSTGTLTVDTTGTAGLEIIQDTAADLNVTEASGSAIKTAVELIDNAVYVDDADWTADTSSHMLVGGVTQATPTANTDGDTTPLITNALRELRIAIPESDLATASTTHVKKYYTSAGAATDGIIWSPAAGKRWYVTDLIINVSAAATVTLEDDLSGGDSAVFKAELAANSGISHSFNTPLYSGEDAADLLITTSAGNVYVTVTGYEI